MKTYNKMLTAERGEEEEEVEREGEREREREREFTAIVTTSNKNSPGLWSSTLTFMLAVKKKIVQD